MQVCVLTAVLGFRGSWSGKDASRLGAGKKEGRKTAACSVLVESAAPLLCYPVLRLSEIYGKLW
jgi:hypothetical protein